MSREAVYTLDEFRKAYDLSSQEAKRIFNLSGPSRPNLDVFMKVYRQPKLAEKVLEIGR